MRKVPFNSLNMPPVRKPVSILMNAMGYISSDSVIAKKQFKGDPVYDAFVEEMQYANARGPLPEWPDISDAISLAFNEVMTDSQHTGGGCSESTGRY